MSKKTLDKTMQKRSYTDLNVFKKSKSTLLPYAPSGEMVKTAKGEATRAQILETALALFRERGYERTTMRLIARRAGVSLGNAYYYFRSKEHLIQAFYARTHQEHLTACEQILDSDGDLATRLRGVMRAKLGTIMPYHRFAGALFRTAADPASPLNPFSEMSEPVRREATAVFERLIEDEKLPEKLRGQLPRLLWTYHMGVILYWIHDASPGCDRSYRLMERSVDLICRLIGLASKPLMRPLVGAALAMIEDLFPQEEVSHPEEQPL